MNLLPAWWNFVPRGRSRAQKRRARLRRAQRRAYKTATHVPRRWPTELKVIVASFGVACAGLSILIEVIGR